MLTLDRRKLEYFAQARYDMVFGNAYQHTRTFSFPVRFQDIPVSEVVLTPERVEAQVSMPKDPRLLEFLIACHYFWCNPEVVTDGYAIDVMSPASLSSDVNLTYQDGAYFLNGEQIVFSYHFKPPYMKE